VKHKRRSILRVRKGFTIIESLVYILLTTLILVIGINLFVLIYTSYLEEVQLTIKYNNCQNFFINLDNVICEGGIEEITVNNNQVLFSKGDKVSNSDKIIKSYGGKIFIKYIKFNVTQTINTMLEDIDTLEVKKKGKLIYFIVHDKEGKEFVRCI
jgi:competence protein ComGF